MTFQKIDHLTDQQERIARFIRRRIEDDGQAPTLAEIGEAFGMRSRSTVHYHLQRLEQHGAIARDPHRPRAIRLT